MEPHRSFVGQVFNLSCPSILIPQAGFVLLLLRDRFEGEEEDDE
jgi:hypothetical protein